MEGDTCPNLEHLVTTLAILLVIASSIIHALWNTVTKRIESNTTIFVWLTSCLEIATLGPLAFVIFARDGTAIGWAGVAFMIVSAILHVVYFLLLTGGYRVGDLSIVYPLARGVGPLFITAGAILFLGETPSPLALFATALIVLGVLALTGDPRLLGESAARPGIVYGLLTALSVAAYSLWDAAAVTRALVPPLVYLWGVGVVRTVLLLPYVVFHRPEVREAWDRDRWKALIVALLSPGGYLLILIALTLSPVSYVAPMRSISILFGVVIGVQVLDEADPQRRILGAATMVFGVILLGLA